MKKLIILLTLALSFSFADAKVYTSLKAKDYKNVQVIVEEIPKSNSGITKKDIQNKVKLILLRNGFKTSNEIGKDFIYIYVNVMPLNNARSDAFSLDISYIKFADNHFDSTLEKNSSGSMFKPDQGNYGTIGFTNESSLILTGISKYFEKFLVDYMESNIE